MNVNYNPLSLAGRRFMVTGASSGLGRAASSMIGKLGGQVVLVARDKKRLNESFEQLHGNGHQVEVFDLNNTNDISPWLKSIASRCGTLDGLIHCAGVQFTRPVRITDLVSYEDTMRVNVTAAFALAKAFRQRGVYSGASSIIFLSSVAAVKGKGGIAAYSTSKSALLGMTRSLAAEYARDGIRVNCLVVGHVATEMAAQANRTRTPEQMEELTREHLLGLGNPTDVAHSIVFLLADTGRWITGSSMVVDGGFSIS